MSSSQIPMLGIENGSSRLGIGYGVVRAKFRNLESGMEEFERISRLGIGNGGV